MFSFKISFLSFKMGEVDVSSKVEEFLQGKKPSNALKKKFIVSYGPPASGKSKILDLVKSEFALQDQSIVEVNVDNIIESIKSYQEKIQDCITNFQKETSAQTVSTELVKNCSQIYNHYRKSGDAVSTALLQRCLKEGFDIIYETTGNNMSWFLTHDLPLIERTANYEIEIFYFTVSLDHLLERAFKRAQKIGRLPEKEYIESAMKNAQQNFLSLAENKNFSLHIIDNDFVTKEIFRKKEESVYCALSGNDLAFLPAIRSYVEKYCIKTGNHETNFTLILIAIVLLVLIVFLFRTQSFVPLRPQPLAVPRQYS